MKYAKGFKIKIDLSTHIFAIFYIQLKQTSNTNFCMILRVNYLNTLLYTLAKTLLLFHLYPLN